MAVQIKAPAMGESIAEATVAKWMVKEGDFVKVDQMVAELETDKVNLEVTASVAGKITKIVAAKGATVKVGQVMGEIDETSISETRDQKLEGGAASAATVAMPAATKAADARVEKSGPAVQKLVAEGKSVEGVAGNGKDGRLTKGDVLGGASAPAAAAAPVAAAPVSVPVAPRPAGGEERVPMTRIRKTISTRLKQAQNTAAMLTTYNEVDMSTIMKLRAKYKDSFEKKNGVKLGFMGFFTKAVTEALQAWPALNAEIDGEDLVYKHHYDIGIAVSSDKGLVVPVLRDAEQLSIVEIEKGIADFGARARNGGLKPDELAGGTFSITNGGVFGSLMSMPILNYPQVGILGMHTIKERPVVVDGQIVIRPMMYLALTYDHRIVDGREAVSFLVQVKDFLEEPGKILLGM